MTPDDELDKAVARANLITAIQMLTEQLKRHNDLISPPQTKRSEIELGKANYENIKEREINESIRSHFSTPAGEGKTPRHFGKGTGRKKSS